MCVSYTAATAQALQLICFTGLDRRPGERETPGVEVGSSIDAIMTSSERLRDTRARAPHDRAKGLFGLQFRDPA